jgi:predicted RNA-binding Zn-ribbon protein involved in translation (DUF1610 family)
MTDSSRFRCPACGFTVFNRRLAVCESCKAPLPANLMFSGKELARLEEESERIAKIRADMALEAERLEGERQRRRGDGG